MKQTLILLASGIALATASQATGRTTQDVFDELREMVGPQNEQIVLKMEAHLEEMYPTQTTVVDSLDMTTAFSNLRTMQYHNLIEASKPDTITIEETPEYQQVINKAYQMLVGSQVSFTQKDSIAFEKVVSMQNKNFLIENNRVKPEKNFVNIFESAEYKYIQEAGYKALVAKAQKPKTRTPEFERVVDMLKYNYGQALLPKTSTKKFINIPKTSEYKSIIQTAYEALVKADEAKNTKMQMIKLGYQVAQNSATKIQEGYETLFNSQNLIKKGYEALVNAAQGQKTEQQRLMNKVQEQAVAIASQVINGQKPDRLADSKEYQALIQNAYVMLVNAQPKQRLELVSQPFQLPLEQILATLSFFVMGGLLVSFWLTRRDTKNKLKADADSFAFTIDQKDINNYSKKIKFLNQQDISVQQV